MALTPVPSIDPALPAAPNPSDSEAVFDADSYAWTSAQPGFGNDLKAIGDATYANALWAETKATEAELSAALAESAAGSAGAVVWVSGSSYSSGNVVYSPINFQNYRRKTNGSGTVDPSLDATNWAIIGVDPTVIYPFSNQTIMAQNHAIALYF